MRKSLLLMAVFLFALCTCSSEPEPRKTVMRFLQSLRSDTTSYSYLEGLLDLDQLALENSVYTYDTTLTLEANKQRLVQLFLPGGEVRERWTKDQVVLGDVEVMRDTATVEVSFIDRNSVPVKQYYNKMGVHLVDGHWKIFAFRLF